MIDNKKIWSAYKGKTVLITGHTGFKGSWLATWLTQLGARVVGVSLEPPSTPSNFAASRVADDVRDIRQDIRDVAALRDILREERPDFLFHMAAQALLRASYANPFEAMSTNAIGTASVLEALRSVGHSAIAVMITSDKAYDNVEWVWGYRENDRLGGKDPYSASKGMAELAIRAYVDSYFRNTDSKVRLAVARAGNVIGGGDWAADRIIPDCVRAWSAGRSVDIRNPNATRPWQHVLEPLSGYLTLGALLVNRAELHGQAYNFGPPADQDVSVGILIDEMSKHWPDVRWRDVSGSSVAVREAMLLRLNCDKAMSELSWRATLRFEETVAITADWYKHYYREHPDSMRDFSLAQIKNYMVLHDQRRLQAPSS
jgi:CDP-glucose 4,6-dehydratase